MPDRIPLREESGVRALPAGTHTYAPQDDAVRLGERHPWLLPEKK